MNSSSSMSPAASSRRASQRMVPEPVRRPCHQAVQHRAAIERDRGQVRRRCRHDHRRRGLVAARRQDDAVDGIAVQNLHEAEVGEIAVDGRRRPPAAFLDRVNRKFERDTTRLADAGPHAFRQALVDAVAWREVGPCLRDAYDGLARLQLFAGQAEIHVALDIERGHAGIERVVEPATAAQLFPGHEHSSRGVVSKLASGCVFGKTPPQIRDLRRGCQRRLKPFVTPSIRPLKKSRWAKVKAMMPGATTTT